MLLPRPKHTTEGGGRAVLCPGSRRDVAAAGSRSTDRGLGWRGWVRIEGAFGFFALRVLSHDKLSGNTAPHGGGPRRPGRRRCRFFARDWGGSRATPRARAAARARRSRAARAAGRRRGRRRSSGDAAGADGGRRGWQPRVRGGGREGGGSRPARRMRAQNRGTRTEPATRFMSTRERARARLSLVRARTPRRPTFKPLPRRGDEP